VFQTPWQVAMRARDPEEEGRVATTLELFFDLVFVVAVAFGASELHHSVAAGANGGTIVSYAIVFFAIWWAWVNFTWFGSAYDAGDVTYRLAIFLGMTGALILAAGISRAFEEHDLRIALVGYAVMRVALVWLWLRAARSDVERRTTARRFAIGLSVVQVGWAVAVLAFDELVVVLFVVLAACELAVPVWAESAGRTSWHQEHIVERYGLFTIIVLGESILSSSIAIQSALSDAAPARDLAPVIVGGLLIVFSMWWLYFEMPRSDALTSMRRTFLWGYGHYLVWGAAAAVGAGLAIAVDEAAGHADIARSGAGASVAVPLAVFLLSVWGLHYSPSRDRAPIAWRTPAAAILVLSTPSTGAAPLLSGLIMVVLLASKVVTQRRAAAPFDPPPEVSRRSER